MSLSSSAGSLAVSALAAQPLLALGRRFVRHQMLGSIALCLVLVHVAALFVESPEDTRFALSPDGPTRARMALIATLALFGVATLGALRTRLPISAGTWRVLHTYLALVVITLGIGHAVLTDGRAGRSRHSRTRDLGALGLLAIPAAHVTRSRRRSRT
jgi:predicted ferric reductase